MLWGSRHRGERVIHAGERMTHMPSCLSRLDRQTVALSHTLLLRQYIASWFTAFKFKSHLGKINLKNLSPIQTDV